MFLIFFVRFWDSRFFCFFFILPIRCISKIRIKCISLQRVLYMRLRFIFLLSVWKTWGIVVVFPLCPSLRPLSSSQIFLDRYIKVYLMIFAHYIFLINITMSSFLWEINILLDFCIWTLTYWIYYIWHFCFWILKLYRFDTIIRFCTVLIMVDLCLPLKDTIINCNYLSALFFCVPKII